MTMEERIRRQREWELSTPEGRLSMERQWGEPFDIKPDGTFRIDDLTPGQYQLQLRMLQTENSFGIDRVTAFVDFEVPPLPPGQTRSDEPVDVGTVKVKTRPQLVLGQPAPDFTVTKLDDGKPLKLSDFKGKTVVLKWWWNWSQMETEGPAISRAYELIQKHPDVVLVTIGFDQEIATTKKRVADWKLGGIHTHAAWAEDNWSLPEAYLNSPSTMCIIGPDGTARAKNLHAENADVEIAKVLLER
jgi:hypothetical protein